VLLGWSLKELDELDEAEKLLMEAEAQIRQNALAFKLLASIAERAGDLERAESLLDISRTLQPSPLSRGVFFAVTPPVEASVKSEKTEAESLLGSLLDQFEAKPPKGADVQKIFSDEDREQLAGVLRRLKH
jgi:tetratricopeptide (TPR) repeat protein